MAQEPETSLPRVVLKDKAVPFAVLSLIPLSTVEKYHVAAFESGATVLKLALVHPEALKQGFYASLKELGQKIGKNIELYQTDSASMQAILKQYKAGDKALSPATSAPVAAAVPTWPPPAKPEVKEESPPKPKAEPVKPPLFELGKTVSATYLKKIPYTFSTLHHVVCVDFLPPNTYWFVTDEEHHQGAESSLKFIEEENKVVAHLITVKTAELKDLLSHYEAVIESEKKEKEEKANRETQEKEKVPAQFPGSVPEKVEVPSEVGKDVVVPQAQGSILTAEEERPGIAGIFQKMAQSIA
ncbi:MAG: hypothetical protein K0S20_738, partial [Patescibacteria group bacterium]|nr:hypothetical protein [Patescibacteria group bacterium]